MTRPADMPVPPDMIRAWFADAMSAMYAREVPLYGTLIEIVARVNADVLAGRPDAMPAQEAARLGAERHGAIRVGLAPELENLARVFAAMGMEPVGYYDLAPAGIPVHSTARSARMNHLGSWPRGGATHALGIHWGTFQLTDEVRDAPRLALAGALSAAGIAPHRSSPPTPAGSTTSPSPQAAKASRAAYARPSPSTHDKQAALAS